jgi:hypothetical protein
MLAAGPALELIKVLVGGPDRDEQEIVLWR